MRNWAISAIVSLTCFALPAHSQNPPLAPLRNAPLPAPTGTDRYVQSQEALVALGKAFFWDMQVGSDGITACATCHFHAGADHRIQNQLSGPAATINYRLTAQDFPFHRLSNTGNNNSAVLSDKRQVAGSMGVVAKAFQYVDAGTPQEQASNQSAPAQFLVNGILVRQVTGRNTPSVINAVYNVRNFWDGRALSAFTTSALLLKDGQLQSALVRIENASLASQAVGPALNATEMSWSGRSWPELGRKLRHLRPLTRQRVSRSDSVLGPFANPDGNGLHALYTYEYLIQAAFRPEYWSSSDIEAGYTQADRNFELFWGLSIQAYESTLISDDSRVDQYLAGRTEALSPAEVQGLNQFSNGGSQCLNCHNGPESTSAGWSGFNRQALGFFRIGVTPIPDDAGIALGAFKTPGLRNVEFTGPYFHDGGQATLDQVLLFYNRNGDFPAGGNLGPGIGNIRLGGNNRNNIVAFLKAFSDDRVRYQRAPFDHPSLCVPNGHSELSPGALILDDKQQGSVAQDTFALIPEVGREGASAPLQTFEELLQGIGNDGSRANTMNTSCQP
jgi:cytochrome c peroxidase